MKDNYCVIMAGGIGSRFWPMSRTDRPKQFLDILGIGKTLIQQTYERFERVCPAENIYIVTNSDYFDQIIEQIPSIRKEQIICEPSRRNTAPCIAYASHKIHKINPNANIVVAPSDHLILKEDVFADCVNTALEESSKNDCLITMGIKPHRPDTGYGYIQFDSENTLSNPELKKVKVFTEKPDLEIAKEFLSSGDFYWNSGIFIWNVKSIINSLAEHLPEINNLFSEGTDSYNTESEVNFISDVYAECKNISIDYGVMEKANNVYILCADFGWLDLGTWGSLYSHLDKDPEENATVGKKVYMYDSKNCMVHVPNDKLVLIQGLDDYIVSESNNVLLICKKIDEQRIKESLADLKTKLNDDFL
ncbi:MAG: mannose-1-phosphate guanylyltransferase [Flavobacteriales bacterium]|nr:mannose-1-phosphate guanylyltransferase [Flavobacteriales bacterium]